MPNWYLSKDNYIEYAESLETSTNAIETYITNTIFSTVKSKAWIHVNLRKIYIK